MKLAISPEQRQFFRKHRKLELEDLLKSDQLKKINLGLESVLEQRLNVKRDRVFLEPPGRIYAAGRDLWRSDEALKKLVLSSQLAELASELIEFKPLRIGFDQFYPSMPVEARPIGYSDSYRETLLHPQTLKDLSCVQGVLCALAICLAGSENDAPKIQSAEAPALSSSVIFPSRAGNAVIFDPQVTIDFHSILQEEPHRYLLITYTHATSLYFLQETDPLTHEMKRLGYVFGDRLSDKLNPIVYR